MGSSLPAYSAWAVGLGAVIAGLVFLAGFLTPIIGSLLALSYLIDSIALFASFDASKHAGACQALYLAVISAALVLIGPGAFSADARLFGRLEIIIPDGRRPPR